MNDLDHAIRYCQVHHYVDGKNAIRLNKLISQSNKLSLMLTRFF